MRHEIRFTATFEHDVLTIIHDDETLAEWIDLARDSVSEVLSRDPHAGVPISNEGHYLITWSCLENASLDFYYFVGNGVVEIRGLRFEADVG